MLSMLKVPGITLISLSLMGVAATWIILDPILEPHLEEQVNVALANAGGHTRRAHHGQTSRLFAFYILISASDLGAPPMGSVPPSWNPESATSIYQSIRYQCDKIISFNNSMCLIYITFTHRTVSYNSEVGLFQVLKSSGNAEVQMLNCPRLHTRIKIFLVLLEQGPFYGATDCPLFWTSYDP